MFREFSIVKESLVVRGSWVGDQYNIVIQQLIRVPNLIIHHRFEVTRKRRPSASKAIDTPAFSPLSFDFPQVRYVTCAYRTRPKNANFHKRSTSISCTPAKFRCLAIPNGLDTHSLFFPQPMRNGSIRAYLMAFLQEALR